ncbi:MAG: IS1 family transposase [Cyanobacteria bacterium SBLK]|nr:IS1 family transposase [Cyanobacteria bacterium SBLK]
MTTIIIDDNGRHRDIFMQCPDCQSTKIIKCGKSSSGAQVHKCKDCGRKFTGNSPGAKSASTNPATDTCEQRRDRRRNQNPNRKAQKNSSKQRSRQRKKQGYTIAYKDMQAYLKILRDRRETTIDLRLPYEQLFNEIKNIDLDWIERRKS